ncbi:MAG TPA: hypothetical protein VEY13_00700 [Rubrobacteraceae bacterium]|nr:hypothetical protein [Rubrobacteraceae bacterium]
MSVFAGEVPFVEYLVGFLIPATLGNAVVGVFLVALLNYGQVPQVRQEDLSGRVHRRPTRRLLSRRTFDVAGERSLI